MFIVYSCLLYIVVCLLYIVVYLLFQVPFLLVVFLFCLRIIRSKNVLFKGGQVVKSFVHLISLKEWREGPEPFLIIPPMHENVEKRWLYLCSTN